MFSLFLRMLFLSSELKHMRSLLWESQLSRGQEYFSLFSTDYGYLLRGSVIALEASPTLTSYQIECDKSWVTKHVNVQKESDGKTNRLTLTVDDKQTWFNGESIVPFARGLFDVDLEFSPSTNTLHIRRMNLKTGESREVNAVWIRTQDLKLEPIMQTYTKINDRHYGYIHPASGLKTILEVDELGLVVRYGDLWHRLP